MQLLTEIGPRLPQKNTPMTQFVLPPPIATVDAQMPDGAIIRLRQHGNPEGDRILLSHGNGFATNGYYPFWRLLENDFDLIVYDQRNHGENPFFSSYGHHVDGFRSDLVHILNAVDNHFGAKPRSGAFHSVSAVAALAHAVTEAWAWERLVLFDPPLVPAAGEALHEQAFNSERFMAGWAFNRDHEFDSPDALADYLKSNKGMQRWVPGAHDLLARCLLHQDGDVWRLNCPRELESNVYLSNGFAPIWEHLPKLHRVRDRLLILTADPDAKDVRYPPLSAKRMAEAFGFNVQGLSGTTHMLQLEQPEACATLVREFLRQHP